MEGGGGGAYRSRPEAASTDAGVAQLAAAARTGAAARNRWDMVNEALYTFAALYSAPSSPFFSLLRPSSPFSSPFSLIRS